jgi:peroxiredoxin Q/BCP
MPQPCEAGFVLLFSFRMKIRTFLVMSFFSALFASANAEPLKVGDPAPAISGVTDAGTTLDLAEVYKKNTYTLVWFYPKALTGGCTKQGCSLRDASDELTQRGVAIVGVSTDSVEKQKEFKDVNHFAFPLIADTDKKVVKAFGQTSMMASREAYLIKDGKIVYKDEKQTEKQAENVLAYLNSVK